MKQLTDEAYVLIREALKASINVPCYDGHPVQEAALAVLEALKEVPNNLQQQNEALVAEITKVKEVEFPAKVEAVVAGWKLKCERLEERLANAADVKDQKPAAYIVSGGKQNDRLLHIYEYELELVAPKIMCKPLFLASVTNDLTDTEERLHYHQNQNGYR